MSKSKDAFKTTFNYDKCLEKLELKLAHTEKRLKNLGTEDQDDPTVINSIEKANADLVGFQNLRDEINNVMSMDKYYKTGACKLYHTLGIDKALFMARMLYNSPNIVCDWYCATPDFGDQMKSVDAVNSIYMFKKDMMSKMSQTDLDAKHTLVEAHGSAEDYTPVVPPEFDMSAYPINKYAWFIKIWLEMR